MTTIGDHLRSRGFTRRDFLRIGAVLAGATALRPSPLDRGGPPARLARALARSLDDIPRRPLLWLAFQDCAGCTEALTRSAEPTLLDLLFESVSLDYHETLAAGYGSALEAHRRRVMDEHRGEYLLVVEGSVPRDEFCVVGGRAAADLLTEAAAGALAVVAVGTCASYGGVAAARPSPTGARSVRDVLGGRTVVNVPGCPAVPEVTTAALAGILVDGAPPELDALGRPTALYGSTVHDQCERKRFYRRGQFATSFDDESARAGWCLAELGCRGPETHNACPVRRWSGLSYPVQSGHPCLGCSEPGFWDALGYAPARPTYLPFADR